MKQGLFPHTRKFEKPMSGELVQKELARLSDEDALPKREVATALFFQLVEKHLRAFVDKETSLPHIRAPYLYMSDEGFVTVFTVLYSLFRASCKEAFTKSEEIGEHTVLTLEGKTAKKTVRDTLALSDKTLSTLLLIAKASGFSLDISVSDGVLRLRFSFVRFRAIPLSAYSCAEDFVSDKMYRAFQLFMREGSDAFDA